MLPPFRHARLVFVLVPLILLAACSSAMNDPRARQLETFLAANDLRATDLAKQLGPAAVPVVEPHVSDAHPNTCHLAVQCVLEAGGPQAPRVLLKACELSGEQARYEAARGLSRVSLAGSEKAALVLFDRTRDPYLKNFIALALGRTGGEAVGELKHRFTALPPTSDDAVRDALIAALARHDDADARRALFGLYAAARGARSAQVIELSKYVDRPAQAKALAPMLKGREDAIDISNHAFTHRRRTCDLAIDEISRLQPGKIPFKTDGYSRYTEDQIAQAARACEALPPLPN